MTKERERREAFFRIIVVIVSGIILCLWRYLIVAFVIIHLLAVVFTGRRNKDMALFSEYFNTELYKFTRYLTFVSNSRPFPFTKLERMSRFS